MSPSKLPPVVGLRDIESGAEYLLPKTKSTVVGSRLGNDIVVIGEGVDRVHCRFSWKGDVLIVEDAGSVGGTIVKGESVQRAEVEDGQIIYAGSVGLAAFADDSSRRQHVAGFLVGDDPDFRAAIEKAIVALTRGRGVVLKGERGSGRWAMTGAILDIVLGRRAPVTTARFAGCPVFPVCERWYLQRTTRHGALVLHGVGDQDSYATASVEEALRRMLPDILEATDEGWLRFVMSVSALNEFVPKHVPVVEIPPLRARGGDLRLLLDRFCRRLFDADARTCLPEPLVDALLRYAWPGNLTELAFAVIRLSHLKKGANPDLEFDDDAIGEFPALRGVTVAQWFERRGIPVRLLADAVDQPV